MQPYPNVPKLPAVMAIPFNIDPQVALRLLERAGSLIAGSASQDELLNVKRRAEAACTLECLAVVLGGEQAAEQDAELVPAAQTYLQLAADAVRNGVRDWALAAVSRLRFAWG